MKRIFRCFSVLFLLSASVLQGALKPEEVAVIATAGSDSSLAIARHYVVSRNIPPRNVFLLKRKYETTLSRETWEKEVRPELKTWLQSRPEVRCVVCCWDVPLRIAAYDPKSSQVAGRVAYLQDWRKHAVRQAQQMLRAMYLICPTEEDQKMAETLEVSEKVKVDELGGLFEKALQETQKRIRAAESAQQQPALQKLQIMLQTASGLAGFYNVLKQRQNANDPFTKSEAFAKKMNDIRTLLLGKASSAAALEILPESNTRDAEILRTVEQVTGIIGVLSWLDEQIKITRENESAAAFDSELSAIFQEATTIFQWIANYQSLYAVGMTQYLQPSRRLVEKAAADGSLLPVLEEVQIANEDPQPMRPVLMVARLEAPTVDIVKRCVDQAIATEKTGLSGTVYLDARGGRPSGTPNVGSYEKLDQSLHDLAARLKNNTALDVQFETTEALLQKKDCPEPAALYCGWYSLANYVDAFEFVPGAVAYHVASMEAVSLKAGKYWCPNLLSHGACATFGATFEPYLSAFPEPDEFYSLLLTGRYTLIECYYYTKPFNSWAMTFVGDPLYNPFQKNPILKMEQLPQTLKQFFKVK